jgi:hypothetical protein
MAKRMSTASLLVEMHKASRELFTRETIAQPGGVWHSEVAGGIFAAMMAGGLSADTP